MKPLLLLSLLVAPCAFAGYLGIDYTERGEKVVLTKIDKRSPAEYYGLKAGDIILTDMTPDEFIASIKKAQSGQILSFRVKNSAGVETVHIPLSAGPGAPFLKGIMQAD
jgi:predicted metalloprotease with PDZ domain